MSDFLDFADRVWRGAEDAASYHRGEWRGDGLQPVADGVWMWPAFGNVYVVPTDDGPMLLDTGDQRRAEDLFAVVRDLDDRPLHTAVYSHGHIDHVFGVDPFDRVAAEQGLPAPRVVAQELVVPRFDRYRLTRGFNTVINQRQFQAPGLEWPDRYRYPDLTYADELTLDVGGVGVELRHGLGETDDATMAWLPDKGVLACGDFFIWASPNAGNPQKVQRFAREWAQALRWMAGLGAQVLLPGHGLPIVGVERVAQSLSEAAELLEVVHDQTVALMNEGALLDEVVHEVKAPSELLERPYLRPSYDEPEFVVRNVWRRYGGWWDGDPAHLKPATSRELAREVAALGGGAPELAARAGELLDRGEWRLAGHFAQMAVDADPESVDAHRARVKVYRELEQRATSTMAKGVYGWAVAESRAALEGNTREEELRAKTAGRSTWAF
ncbi:MBL fold metallo-hydrolase [Marmoricola endophyticus]|uniref:MBL fold metallo-hydrolase n=1 Tax=Marmoricola endophyticus TaxID=2040280 RepID=A0A917BCT2_9ACTN|nr:alkyl sulfatase dimerization domain-containing protein [Marmoricola endophyticus]GGF36456.1 MBL fold metallo-hydrolase [Marmoricola endophyticus]